MSDEFRLALVEQAPDEFTARPLRPRQLKDLGRVQLWWCGRPGSEADGVGAAADRRRNLRWERLAEVLRELEELRDVGERLLGGSARKNQPALSLAVAIPKGRSFERPLEGLERCSRAGSPASLSVRGRTPWSSWRWG